MVLDAHARDHLRSGSGYAFSRKGNNQPKSHKTTQKAPVSI